MTEIDPDEALAIIDAADPYPGLQEAAVNEIVQDVVLGRSPEQSRITYGDAEHRYRADIERWVAENPDATIELPFDIPTGDD